MKPINIFLTETVGDGDILNYKKTFSDLYSQVKHQWLSDKKILFVSAGSVAKDTNNMDEPRPAQDLFIGEGHNILKQNLADCPIDWVILTSGYGLVDANAMIKYYDNFNDTIHKMSKEELSILTRYNIDLCNLIRQNHYEKIILCLPDSKMKQLDLWSIRKVASPDCEIIVWETKTNRNMLGSIENFTGKEYIVVRHDKRIFKTFGVYRGIEKQIILSRYVQNLNNYPNQSIREFVYNRIRKYPKE